MTTESHIHIRVFDLASRGQPALALERGSCYPFRETGKVVARPIASPNRADLQS